MKAYEGVEAQLHTFLKSALHGDKWSTSCSGGFTPGERVPGTHWIGGWVGPRIGRNAVAKRKNPFTVYCRESKSGRPARSLVTILTERYRLVTILTERYLFQYSRISPTSFSYLLAFFPSFLLCVWISTVHLKLFIFFSFPTNYTFWPISTQDPFLHKTTKKSAYIHSPSGIRTRDPNVSGHRGRLN
jgi:hypothetical protein